MKILVTGVNGFLGSNLVRELLNNNCEVCGFLEPNTQTSTLSGLDIELYIGNILNIDDVKEAANGCNAIIHTAANTSIWPTRSELMGRVNIEGTMNIINAAYNAEVERVIYVGTANSFGFGSKTNLGNESRAYKSAKYNLDYMDTKYKAQQLILHEVRENGLPAVIVNPTFMLGPYDSKPGSGAMILSIYNKQLPGFSTGGRNYIYVKDVATGIFNALKRGNIGECYILGNRNLTYKEMFIKIAGIIEVSPPAFTFPDTFIKAYGMFGSLKGHLSKQAPTVSYNIAQIACDEHYYSAQKAVKNLSLPQTPIEIAIMEAYQWFRDNQYIR